MPFALKVGIKEPLVSTYMIDNQQLSHFMQFGGITIKGLPTLDKPMQFLVCLLAWFQEHHSLHEIQHTVFIHF